MTHPEWALKHKRKNTEIRCIRGHYYLYQITSKWDPAKKRTKKVTGKQIGTINEEWGLIPTGMKRKGRIPPGESPFKVPPETIKEEPVQTKEKSVKIESFLDHFSKIEDPRSSRNQLHTVSEILLVTFCAVICGADGWEDVEEYGNARLDHLREYFEYKNGAPSDDTIRRFFRLINAENFEKLFREWMESIAKKANIKVIAIDGKSSKHSFDGDGKMLHTLSAFATESRIVLGQEKVSEKTNEITAIPKMLEWLDVKDHIITIDAMGCQYEIANKILKKEGDYIFSLKGNQGNLSDDVIKYFADTKHLSLTKNCVDYDKGHGRIETRKCFISHDIKWLQDKHPNWQTIKSIILIQSTRESKKKSSTESRYYISSLDYSKNDLAAQQILRAIRSHWAIENSLHWILDMSFNDDQSRIRKGNAPHLMAIIRHVVANVLQLTKEKLDKPKRQSIKRLRKLCGWDTAILDKTLSTKNS